MYCVYSVRSLLWCRPIVSVFSNLVCTVYVVICTVYIVYCFPVRSMHILCTVCTCYALLLFVEQGVSHVQPSRPPWRSLHLVPRTKSLWPHQNVVKLRRSTQRWLLKLNRFHNHADVWIKRIVSRVADIDLHKIQMNINEIGLFYCEPNVFLCKE